MSRRRRSSGELIVISWRDIPAQVTATRGREKAKALLTARFQHAIDRAAAVAGLTETDAYVNEWRRTVRPITGAVDGEAEDEATRIENAYSSERLEQLVRAGGLDPTPIDHPPSESPTALDHAATGPNHPAEEDTP